MNNKYLNFLNWAVFTMIDRKTQDDHKSWLIWSTWEDGAGVVVPRDDGKLVLLTGWQSNLAYC